MHATVARIVLLVSVALALVAAGSASATPEPGACSNDTKSLGPIEVSTVESATDGVTTWWELTRDGLSDAGAVDPEAALAELFDLPFDQAVVALVAGVAPLDKNGNGFVCASSVRGTRAFVGDPDFAYYYFAVIDDKHFKG